MRWCGKRTSDAFLAFLIFSLTCIIRGDALHGGVVCGIVLSVAPCVLL